VTMMKLPEHPASASTESNRSKIVIGVDDVPENLTILKAYVSAAGFTFMGAASGEECMALTSRVMPRLILLDIEMSPGIDGLAHLIQRMAGIRWRVSRRPLILFKDWVSRPFHSHDHAEPHPPYPTIRSCRSTFQRSAARN